MTRLCRTSFVMAALATGILVVQRLRPAPPPPRIHSVNGSRLSSIWDGASSGPEIVAYFSTHSKAWAAAVRYPACRLRTAGPAQSRNPSRIERLRVALETGLLEVRTALRARAAYAAGPEILGPIWGEERAPCPSYYCDATYCFDGVYCSCIQGPILCPDRAYCTHAYLGGC
jgi:hypothetical protein